MLRLAACLLVALGALGFVLTIDTARAEEPDDAAAVAFYEAGVEALGGKAAAALWKACESARKAGLHAFANEAAQRVLKLDPDHKKARKRLGFVRKRRGWVLDFDEARKVPRENERPSRMTDAELRERERKWRDEDLGEALSSVARLYALLGARCAEKGYDVEARRAREDALRLDTDCEMAREALGYERVGETWMTAAQKRARASAARPERFEESSHLDEVLRQPLTKVRSANVVAESVFGSQRTMSLVAALETTYTYYLTDAGRDPNERVFASPVKACFVVTESEWSLWLKDQVPQRADFYRGLHFYRNSSSLLLGVREDALAGSGGAAAMEDNAIHSMTHLLNDLVWKLRRAAWLDEGLAYYYTLKVRGTTESWCVEPDHSRYAAEGSADTEDKVTEAVWRHRIKRLVTNGDDMDLRMLTARPLNELKLSETIKGWSVATWLMDTDRDGALRLLGNIGKAASGAAALEEHFGRSVEETDEAWRAWVRRTH